MRRDGEPSRRIDQPEPGYFRIRHVRGGPLIPARIFHRLGFWSAAINGQAVGDSNPDPELVDVVMRIWTSGTRITADEYHAMLRQPSVLDPSQPIDIAAFPPVF